MLNWAPMISTDEAVPQILTDILKDDYQQVHFIGCEFWGNKFGVTPEKLFKKLKSLNIKNHYKEHYVKTAIILYQGEAQYFVPGSKVSLQSINLYDAIKKANIYSTDFFITGYHEAEKLMTDYCNQFESSNNFKHVNIDYFHHFHELVDHNTKLNIDECNYNFSYMSHNHRMHRKLFSKFLIENNLYQKNLVSFTNGKIAKEKSDQKAEFETHNEFITFPLWTKDDWNYSKNLIDMYNRVDLFDYKNNDISDDLPDNNPVHPFLQKSYIHLVCETLFDYSYPNPNEKIIQAITAKRPFIVIGPARTLTQLKCLGFKTFDSILDESYDTIKDPNERLQKIMTMTLEISKLSKDRLKKMVKDVEDVLNYNYDLLFYKRKNLAKSLKESIIEVWE